MKEEEIKAEIEKIVSRPSVWVIGITNDPKSRKKEHGDPDCWRQWKADKVTIARNIEQYFLEKGMKADPNESKSPKYIYIF
jgi:hypothetical protein